MAREVVGQWTAQPRPVGFLEDGHWSRAFLQTVGVEVASRRAVPRRPLLELDCGVEGGLICSCLFRVFIGVATQYDVRYESGGSKYSMTWGLVLEPNKGTDTHPFTLSGLNNCQSFYSYILLQASV